MPELTSEQRAILQELQRSAAERRERNARAIAEVVGRSPAKKPRLDYPRHTSHARPQR